MPSKLEKRLERFPPFLCYALCRVRLPRMKGEPHWRWGERRRWRRISQQELSQRTGFPVRTLQRYIQQVTWRKFLGRDMLRFLAGCGVELMDIEPTTKKLKEIMRAKTRFCHLTVFQRERLMKKFREWKESRG